MGGWSGGEEGGASVGGGWWMNGPLRRGLVEEWRCKLGDEWALPVVRPLRWG